MASAKQIAWRKKFARMAKSGKFRKKKSTSAPKKNNSSRKTLERRIEHLEKIIEKSSDQNFPSYSGDMAQEKFDLEQAKKKLKTKHRDWN